MDQIVNKARGESEFSLWKSKDVEIKCIAVPCYKAVQHIEAKTGRSLALLARDVVESLKIDKPGLDVKFAFKMTDMLIVLEAMFLTGRRKGELPFEDTFEDIVFYTGYGNCAAIAGNFVMDLLDGGKRIEENSELGKSQDAESDGSKDETTEESVAPDPQEEKQQASTV